MGMYLKGCTPIFSANIVALVISFQNGTAFIHENEVLRCRNARECHAKLHEELGHCA
jgi:hypothetical protein